jgi:hypothetical protein
MQGAAFRRWIPAAAVVCLLAFCRPVWPQAVPAPALDFSALIAAARVTGPLDFCGEPVPIEDPDVRERMEREILSTLADPHQVILWIKRSRQSLAPIEEVLKRQQLPDDLKYVAIAESALRPHAGSPKGAMGFWQFIEPTGRKYGLQIDSARDERRSLQSSTDAALAYLKDLRQMFGAWTLAVAAYNMGENGLRADMAQQNARDYYRLHLPMETQRYVFRILTAKLILKNPERYGFRLEPGDLYPPVACEPVTVDSDQELTLLAVAQAAGTWVKTIRDLNPELRSYRLAPGRHTLLVPQGTARGFQERLTQVVRETAAKRRETAYTVKVGDTLSEIAERHGVSLAELREWNRLDAKKSIQPGMRLVIRQKVEASAEVPKP